MASIRLFRGGFGHVSLLNAASDLVTHAHPEAHIIIWLEGDPGEITVGDSVVVPGPRSAVGVNSFEPHSHSFSRDAEPGSFLAFYIDPDWAMQRRGPCMAGRLFPQALITLDPWLRAGCVGLYDGLSTAGAPEDWLEYEIERLIDHLFEASAPMERGRRVPGSTRMIDFRVRKAIELMRANLSGRMNFDELARSVGLSRPHFFALFKEQMNLTPNVYWNALRMEEALRQVETSGEPLTAVACNLGFSTQSNFTRFFRDHAGVPPLLYREAARIGA